MISAKNLGRIMLFIMLVSFPAFQAWSDGGYVTSTESIAVSADQRAIIIKNGNDISMTFSTGYTGEGDDFGWIIPTPVLPHIEEVSEAGEDGIAAFEFLEQMTAPLIIQQYGSGGGCFPAGTEVLTASGPRGIETVEPGTMVCAYDLSSGEWSLTQVLKRHTHHYDGDMITIRMSELTVRATGNHPFYVVKGDRLVSRPAPQDVPNEEQRTSVSGRWVEARDLKAGDMLLTKSGDESIITRVSSRYEQTKVYNLTIEGRHNYAVHHKGILVHNKGKQEAGGLTSSELLVTVYGSVILEHYEVSVLGATDASALSDWLQDNDYQASSEAEAIFEDYIDRNWAFVAVKLNPGEKRHYENEFLPPLTIKYQHNQLIFPLLISSISAPEKVSITLYVIAESTVISSNFPTATVEYKDSRGSLEYIETCIQNTVGREGKALVILWSDEYCPYAYPERFIDSRYDEFLGLAFVDQLCSSPIPECQMYLTRLEARINPANMSEDIIFVLDPNPQRFKVQFRAVDIKRRRSAWVDELTFVDIMLMALGVGLLGSFFLYG